jgi:hypothetical protein
MESIGRVGRLKFFENLFRFLRRFKFEVRKHWDVVRHSNVHFGRHSTWIVVWLCQMFCVLL